MGLGEEGAHAAGGVRALWGGPGDHGLGQPIGVQVKVGVGVDVCN